MTVETEDKTVQDLGCLPVRVTNGSLTNNSTYFSLSTSGAGDITDVGDCATGACFTGSSGSTLTFKGSSSGTTTLAPAATASGVLTLPNATATLVPDTRTLTGGAGIAAIGNLSADRTLATASGEADFLASGALTCGAATQGKIQVHTTPLQYCDNAATPALQYAAYGSSTGVATSATALAANGSNCSAGSYPLGVDASGASESCTTAASTAADFITGSAQSTLSAEQSLGALTTGLVLNTVAASTGTLSAYGGTSCTNQFPRSLNASGVATCASVGSADITDGTIGYADVDATATLASNPTFGANSVWFSTTGLIFEGATSDTIEGLLTAADPTVSDKTWTLPNETGTICTTGSVCSGYQASLTLPLSMTNGGTNASLTADNGAMAYSSATAIALLASTATASKILLSGASSAPTWSTSTIPTSAGATAGKVLVSDGTNYVLSTPTFPNASATSGKYIKSDGTNWLASTGSASGTGACTNQFARTLNSDAAPTCATVATGDLTTTIIDRTIGSFCGGTLSTTMNCEEARVYVPAACTPQRVELTVTTAPTGAAIIVDANECTAPGTCTTLFSVQSNRPQIAAAAFSGNTTTFNDTTVAAGNYVGFDLDQVGSTVAGSNLTITLVCRVQ